MTNQSKENHEAAKAKANGEAAEQAAADAMQDAMQAEPTLLLPVRLQQTLKAFLATLELNMEMGNARSQIFQQIDRLTPNVPQRPDPGE